MNKNAEIYQDQQAEMDISALIQAAIKAKQESALTSGDIEQTPEGETLTSWKATPEQIARINLGDREALDKFYFDNLFHITAAAYKFMRHNPHLKAIVTWEDLRQQVYHDLRTGFIKLRPYDRAIGVSFFYSFRYAAVGGLDEVYIYQEGKRRCRKRQN